jgi:hypothetical protein
LSPRKPHSGDSDEISDVSGIAIRLNKVFPTAAQLAVIEAFPV